MNGAIETERQRMQAFWALPHDQQVLALVQLHKNGMSDHCIAAAAGLAVEQVRHLLGEAKQVAV